ncbi:MAG: AMP-binding protein, partial [Myxococcaceae bacterium]
MTAGDVIARWAQAQPDADALVADGRRWSWRELESEVRRFVDRLAAAGVREGDRVAVLSPNRPELIPLFHAAGRLGATWAPLNARLAPRELAPLIDRLRPRVVLADEALAAGVPVAITFAEFAQLPPIEASAVPSNPERTRALLFTSGTSGRPRAVELTESNFAALARASSTNLGADPEQRWLACLPLFHIGGLSMVYRCAAIGAAVVLQPRFDVDEVARALREEGITHASLVPTGLGWVMEKFEAAQENAPGHLRAILVGGGPMSPELLGRARARGFPVLQTYGLTEACSQVCTERMDAADGTSSGEPLEGSSLRIVDAAGREVPAGEIGEIEVRGPTVMRGYFEDPEATAEALRDGWLRTRDLGSVDA